MANADYQVELVKARPEYGGIWYRWDGQDAEGWLCPALFRDLSSAPPRLCAKAEAL